LKAGSRQGEAVTFTVAKRLASDLHPVANPAFDPDDGALFVTRIRSRGEELPVTLFRIDVDGEVTEYSGDIANPTGMRSIVTGKCSFRAVWMGDLRLTPFKDAVSFARNLGIATGIAFDADGVICWRSHGDDLQS
jgi:hypothetical protein